MKRYAEVTRKTGETDITVKFSVDGSGSCTADTGIGFLDHMLQGFAKHGFFDLEVVCKGDLYVDAHHSAEDIGIVLGTAIREAVGDKAGIRRYGNFALPMDETLILCAVDLCGRPYYSSDVQFTVPKLGALDTELFAEFFYAVSYSAAMNLHFHKISGANNHHIAEAMFKAFAKALDMATQYDPRVEGILTTKGSL